MPPGLIDRATAFGQGEALAAGKIASHPAFVRFGARITEEGGADVARAGIGPRGRLLSASPGSPGRGDARRSAPVCDWGGAVTPTRRYACEVQAESCSQPFCC